MHDYQAGRYWKSDAAGSRHAERDHGDGPAVGPVVAHRAHLGRCLERDGHRRPAGRERRRRAAAAAAALRRRRRDRRHAGPTPALAKGSSGADVGRLQDFLRLFQFADFTRSDGVFGPRTEAAVMKAQQAFQAKSLYNDKVDGKWGPKSAAAGNTWLEQAAKA